MGDSDGYFTLGRAIAEGRPYEYGPRPAQMFRAPGYPAILAPVFWLSGRHAVMAARVENALLGTLAWPAFGGCARQLFGPRAALLAAAMAAFYPESIATSAMILSDTPFCALMLLQLGLWAAAWKVGRRKCPCHRAVFGAGGRVGRRRGDAGEAQLAAVHSAGGDGRRVAARPADGRRR